MDSMVKSEQLSQEQSRSALKREGSQKSDGELARGSSGVGLVWADLPERRVVAGHRPLQSQVWDVRVGGGKLMIE